MNEESKNNYRQVLRAFSILGSASVINLATGLIKMKAAAVLLGPAGVGLIGLLSNLMATMATLAGLGLGNAGARQIADARANGNARQVAAVRRALSLAALIMAAAGSIIVWIFRVPIAHWLLGDPARVGDVGWAALGVGLTVVSGSQTAALGGLQRTGDLGRVSVLSGLLSAALGITVLWCFGNKGLPFYIIATPFAGCLVGYIYVARLPRAEASATRLHELTTEWRALGKLGFAFMLAGLLSALAQLVVRGHIQGVLGLTSVGYFQAAWTISMTCTGLLVGAMSGDFLPRLTGIAGDHQKSNEAIRNQTEIALHLAGPILLAIQSTALWILQLLYSDAFLPAVDVLRLQALGDVLKVATWPLIFRMLAAGHGRTFLILEALSWGLYTAAVFLMLPRLGLLGVGLAFPAMYACYLPVMYWLSLRQTGFSWGTRLFRQFLIYFCSSLLIMALVRWNDELGAAFGSAATVIIGVYAFRRVSQAASLPGQVGHLVGRVTKLLSTAGFWRR